VQKDCRKIIDARGKLPSRLAGLASDQESSARKRAEYAKVSTILNKFFLQVVLYSELDKFMGFGVARILF
jgi:hypothetical protein